MATTTPDNIWTPDSGSNYNYVIDSAATASSVQNALTRRANSYTGTTTERTAFTTDAPEGTLWSDTNGDKTLWIKQGASWQKVWTVGGPHDGSILLGAITLSAAGTGWYTTITTTLPSLPSGYTYAWTVLANPSAYAVTVNNAYASAGASQLIRIYTPGGSSTFPAGLRLGWRIHTL